MTKWIKCEKSPFVGECVLKGFEDLGNVVATTVFKSGDRVLYVFKTVQDKSYLFMERSEDEWKHLFRVPEEVVENMIGKISFGDKTY